MSSIAREHGQDHADLVVSYALGVLPSAEAAAAEAQISACAQCGDELESLRPVIDTFAAWPTDVLRPSASLWDRVADRIAADARTAPLRPAPEPRPQPDWVQVAPGISCKILATDAASDRVSMLVRLDPGTDYPPHRHEAVEELHMLRGELIVDDQTYYPGDYRRAESGTFDRRVWSETGCSCVLITSLRDALL